MKFMIFFLSLFIACTSWSRGPVDPITPPWPLRTLPVNKVEFPGRWIGVLYDTVWVIEIETNSNEEGHSDIQIRSNTNIMHAANGWLKEQKNVFVGQVLEQEKIFNIMVFRDAQGTKLRIADARGYFDLRLLKSE